MSFGANKVGKVGGYDIQQLQRFSPEQMQLFQQLFSHVSPDSFLSRLAGGDQQTFDEMEAPAKRQFSGLQGNIASRFSGGGGGRGAMSARRSSGFQNTIGSQASNFAQELQSNRQGLQRQALQDLMGISESLLNQKPYDYKLTPGKQSFLQQLLGGALPLAGMGIGGFFGGPMGASIGGQIGGAAGRSFY